MNKFLMFVVYTMLLIFFFSAKAETVIGLELPNRLEHNETGHYNKLWERMRELGLQPQLKVLPLKRALRNFEPNKNSCLFPSKVDSLRKSFPQLEGSDFISSNGIDYVQIKLMTRHGEPAITKLSELQNKKVAIWNGLDPHILFAGLNVEVENTSNESVRLKMLYGNRVDAIVGFIPDSFLAAERLNFLPPTHQGAYTFSKYSKVSMVCFNSEKNKKLVERFNQIYDVLKANGEIRKILGPYAQLDKL